LSWDGDIVQKPGFLMEVLTAIIGPKAEAYKNWMILDGYVEDVSALVGSDKELLAWKDNLLGEARFAWRFVEHCLMGGQVEIICGEPGTGKTEELAKRLVAAGGNAVGGSAQHVNAEVLKKRIKKMGGNQEIGTVYNGYDFRIFDRRENLKEIKRKLFFVDEFGQVSCDAAGIIAMRWKKNSNVLLSVGTGQNLPVGPGRIAEDLLEWLEKHPKALPTCTITTLTKNYRADDFDSRGIVEAFQAIGRGELPQAGPGMKIVTLEDQSDVLAKVISEGTDLKALCILPTRNSAYKTAYGIVERDRYNSEIDFSDMDYKAGEIVIIDNPSENAIKHRLRNGMEVEVAEDANIHSGADAPIWIWGANNKKVLLEVSEVARKGGRTGHAVQGTERDNVVVGIITTRITTRGWLYTSVSRARQQCVIVCTKGGLDECVFSDPKRRTLLPTLLDRAYEVLKLQSTPEQIAKKAKAFVFKAKQLDGLSLARKLVNPSIPAEQHVVELLPYATRNRIRELSANGVISEKLPKVALTALNGLIVRPLSENIKLRRPFYDDREFAGIKLSERAVALRNTIGKSGPVEKVELNRLFMEAIFPDELQVVKTNVPG
jgi:hypothetical protein